MCITGQRFWFAKHEWVIYLFIRTFLEFNMNNISVHNQSPTVHVDGIFSQLSAIVFRYLALNDLEDRISTRMTSIYQSITYLFGFHQNTFNLFDVSDKFCLYVCKMMLTK